MVPFNTKLLTKLQRRKTSFSVVNHESDLKLAFLVHLGTETSQM